MLVYTNKNFWVSVNLFCCICCTACNTACSTVDFIASCRCIFHGCKLAVACCRQEEQGRDARAWRRRPHPSIPRLARRHGAHAQTRHARIGEHPRPRGAPIIAARCAYNSRTVQCWTCVKFGRPLTRPTSSGQLAVRNGALFFYEAAGGLPTRNARRRQYHDGVAAVLAHRHVLASAES